MKYESGWPVRDLLAQYLRNSSQAEKRGLAKIKLGLFYYMRYLYFTNFDYRAKKVKKKTARQRSK